MARAILLGGAIACLVAGALGLGFSAVGIEGLQRALPPLSIDLDALRGAVVAVALGVLAVGVAHVVVLAGLRSGRRRAWSAGVLLAAFLAATLVALAAAAATSAIAWPESAIVFVAGSAAAAVGAVAYGTVVALLVSEIRGRSPN